LQSTTKHFRSSRREIPQIPDVGLVGQ
jgi:hypothetical protein